MSEKQRWIKSKVVIFLGLSNQFAGIFLVDTQEEVDIIEKLIYDFPFTYELYDEIPRLTECTTVAINDSTGEITTNLSYKQGENRFDRSSRRLIKEFNVQDHEDFFKRIKEVFGKS